MEFWGVKVEAGKSVTVTPEDQTLVHISHASIGDCKTKKGETVPLYVKVGDQKLVLGSLVSDSIPQIALDVLFDKEFELSHNLGKGNVYFVGYKVPNAEYNEDGDYFSSDESEEEEEEVPATVTAANVNATKAVAKPKATPIASVQPEEDDSDFDSEDGMDEDESDDEEDSDDSLEEEKEETPKKAEVETRKKRAHEAAPKTPVSSKKAKVAVTPQKTEEKKKGGHTATPHPAKKGGKTPATATQSQKSASQVACSSCKKTFNSTNALESHSKAKHSAAK